MNRIHAGVDWPVVDHADWGNGIFVYIYYSMGLALVCLMNGHGRLQLSSLVFPSVRCCTICDEYN